MMGMTIEEAQMRLRYTAVAIFLGAFLGSTALASAAWPPAQSPDRPDDGVVLQEREEEQERSRVRVDGQQEVVDPVRLQEREEEQEQARDQSRGNPPAGIGRHSGPPCNPPGGGTSPGR